MTRTLDSLEVQFLPGGLRIAQARTRSEKLQGLAGLDDLPADLALHLSPCRSVHTFGMRFALDLIWLDRAGAVVRMDAGVPPGRVRTCLRARSVLETRAGAGPAFLRAQRDRRDADHDER